MLKSRGTLHRSLVAAVASAALVLTACTGDPGDDSPQGGSTPSPSESTSTPSESTEAEPFDVNAADNLDPCTMVPRKTWLTFVPKGERATARTEQQLVDDALGATNVVEVLLNDEIPKYSCVVTYGSTKDPTAAIAWGWYLGRFTPEKATKLFADSGGEKVNRGSYIGVTSGGVLTAQAVGLFLPPVTGFFVTVDAAYDSKARKAKQPAPDGTDKEVYVLDRRMLDVLDLIADHDHDQPRIMLPAGCPDARDPAITAVLGKVEFARGSNDGEGKQFCLYRNRDRGQVLRLRGGTGSQEVLDNVLDGSAVDGRDQDRFEGSSGAEGRAVTTTTGVAAGVLIGADDLRYAFADVEPDFLVDDAPQVPRRALIELLESFYASEPGATPVE